MSEIGVSKNDILARKSQWREHLRVAKGDRGQDFHVGVSASFTAEPITPFIGSKLIDLSLNPRITIAPFNQIFRACMNPSAIFGQEPLDVIVILWRIEDIAGDELSRWVDGDDTALADAESKLSELAEAAKTLEENFQGRIVIGTPPYPHHSVSSIRDLSNPTLVGAFHRKLLDFWCELCSELDHIRLLDLDALQRELGVEKSFDVRKWYLYRQPYSEAFWYAMGRQLGRILRESIRQPKKCIAFDCDNTIWGGILGEEGLGGIELGDEFPGNGYADLQRLLRSYMRRGLLLAILSKNNEDEVWEVFEKHDAMVLLRSDLAAWRINWEPKPENLESVASELKIGTDSFIFLDDSPYEIERMRQTLPEVECFLLPEDPAALAEELKLSGLMEGYRGTDEDRSRTEMVVQERERQTVRASMSEEKFLESLELSLEMFQPGEEHVGRVTQLINKTNQFNLTSIRRTSPEVLSLLQSDRHRVYAGCIEDKFGDYGLTLVMVVETFSECWILDTFLMSCRVMGRAVEHAAMSFLAEEARRSGAGELRGRYVPTPKNAPAAELLPDCGFRRCAESGVYSLDLSGETTRPVSVKLKVL